MKIVAVDPGDVVSGWVFYDAARRIVVASAAEQANTALLDLFRRTGPTAPFVQADVLVVETFQPRGQPLYSQLVWTAIWTGRLIEAWACAGRPWAHLYRERVKHRICGRTNVKDPNVRAALIDRHGGTAAVGKKASQGPLYGVSGHAWQALGVAVAYAEGERSDASHDDPPPGHGLPQAALFAAEGGAR